MPFNFPIQQNRFGELFSEGVGNALATYYGAKQQKRAQDIQDEERAQGKSLFEYSHPGFHFTAPTDTLPVQQKVVETPGVQRTPTGVASDDSNFQRILGSTVSLRATDRYRYGNGYYVDQSEEESDLARKNALAGAGEFQKALLTAMGTAQGNPSVTNYNNARTAKLTYDLAHPKPLPPDPIAVHAANRQFDVSHPLPTPPQSQFVFPTGTNEQGQPIVLKGNTKTGALERTDVGRPAAGGGALGQMQGARLKIAGSQASQADAYQTQYENDLLSGKASIGGEDAYQLKLASDESNKATSAAAEAWLNKHNPRLAQYYRASKIMSSAERLVTPRGGSNALMGLEGMLSSVGPNPDAGLIGQVRDYRKGLVSGLTEGQGGGAQASPIQQKYDAAYQHLKQQGKKDADIKAKIGARP